MKQNQPSPRYQETGRPNSKATQIWSAFWSTNGATEVAYDVAAEFVWGDRARWILVFIRYQVAILCFLRNHICDQTA